MDSMTFKEFMEELGKRRKDALDNNKDYFIVTEKEYQGLSDAELKQAKRFYNFQYMPGYGTYWVTVK